MTEQSEKIRDLEKRVNELAAHLDAATARAHVVGAFAGRLIEELAPRLTPGSAADRLVVQDILGSVAAIGGSVEPATEALLRKV